MIISSCDIHVSDINDMKQGAKNYLTICEQNELIFLPFCTLFYSVQLVYSTLAHSLVINKMELNGVQGDIQISELVKKKVGSLCLMLLPKMYDLNTGDSNEQTTGLGH